MAKESKCEIFKKLYIEENGTSKFIYRNELPLPEYYNEQHKNGEIHLLGEENSKLKYTSGDSPHLRSDGELGKKYKFIKYPKNLQRDNFRVKLSYAWRNTITDKEIEQIFQDHSKLKFPEKAGNSCCWIKFYGFVKKPIVNQGIKKEIKNEICENSCIVCGTTNNIECDHKNDCWMFNDSRIGEKNKQNLSDFQPLCKHCNDVKRQVKSKMTKENKRQPPPPSILLTFGIKFTKGNETFDINDPNWGIGSYWYDPVQFIKDCIQIKMYSK